MWFRCNVVFLGGIDCTVHQAYIRRCRMFRCSTGSRSLWLHKLGNIVLQRRHTVWCWEDTGCSIHSNNRTRCYRWKWLSMRYKRGHTFRHLLRYCNVWCLPNKVNKNHRSCLKWYLQRGGLLDMSCWCTGNRNCCLQRV